VATLVIRGIRYVPNVRLAYLFQKTPVIPSKKREKKKKKKTVQPRAQDVDSKMPFFDRGWNLELSIFKPGFSVEPQPQVLGLSEIYTANCFL
jgi:hypothetical protein